MKKLTVFPYSNDLNVLLKYKNLLDNYEINTIASFKEHKYFLKDYASSKHISYSFDLNSAVLCSDELLLLDNYLHMDLEDYRRIIDVGKKLNRKILLSPELLRELDIPLHKNLNLLENLSSSNVHNVKTITRRRYQINIPVIGILGLGENCDKFLVQVELYKQLKHRGYSPFVLSSNYLAKLLGMELLPTFISEKELSFEEKILKFNHYLYEICCSIKPSQIIIGFPGGIMPWGNNDEFLYFNEASLIIGNAVACDSGILNIYLPNWLDNKYIGNLQQLCKNKFNVPIDIIGISKQKLDYSLEIEKHSCLFLNRESHDKLMPVMQNNSIPVLNIISEGLLEQGISDYISMLEGYPSTL